MGEIVFQIIQNLVKTCGPSSHVFTKEGKQTSH